MDSGGLRTEEAICQAFYELANSVAVNAITIEDIVTQAKVSRRTFYNHFRDKYDVADRIFERGVTKSYRATLGCGSTYWQFARMNIDGFLERCSFARNMSSNTHGLDSWRESASRVLVKILSEHIASRAGQEALTDEVRFHLLFFLRACLWAMLEWEAQGKPVSADELTNRMVAAMPESLRALL